MRQTDLKKVHPRRRRSGMMLAIMAGLIACLTILIAGISMLSANLVRGTRIRMDRVDANNMADAGVDLGIAWLQAQAYPPDNSQLHPLSNFFGAVKDSKGRAVFTAPFGRTGTTLTIGIYADTGNVNATQKRYVIESMAATKSGAKVIVRAYAQQVSFGKYAFFTDIDSSGFWDWNNHFEGPFHSNCSDGKPSTFLWKPSPPDGPMFQYTGPGALETTMTPKWWRGTINYVSAPSNDAEWKSVAAGGLASISINANNYIAMPTTDYAQMYIALGQTPPTTVTSPPSTGIPTRTGVTVSSDGGIFIHGDSQITLSDNGDGNQIFTIVTNPSGYELTQTVTATPTSVTVSSVLKSSGIVVSPSKYPANLYPNETTNSTPKGLLFSDGNITKLSGTIANNTIDSSGGIGYRNQWSIFTDTGNGKDVTITGSLTYDTSRDFTKPQSTDDNFNLNAGTLGIVAEDVVVATSAPAQVDVHADIFCTGTYKAQDYTKFITSTANMTNVGGVIVKQSGLFATVNNSGVLSSGRTESYHYDSRLADHPPPYFPTTGSHYGVVSYQIVTSTLE